MTNLLIISIEHNYTDISCIGNTIRYIYRVDSKQPLPIYCYGLWTPVYETLIQQMEYTAYTQPNTTEEYIWHFLISYPLGCKALTPEDYQFADDIAALFSDSYQVCYSLHTDKDHLHFHYIVSTASYIRNENPIDKEKKEYFFNKMILLAQSHDIKIERKEHRNV